MKKELTILTQNDKETRELAEGLATELITGQNVCNVVSLEGDLGAGKTTFMQGFARGFGVKQQITSPTFIIFRVFDLRRNPFKRLYHFDLYRLKSYEDLEILGFKEIISDPRNMVVIEWGDMIREHLPKHVQITFRGLLQNVREIKIIKK